MKSPNWLKFLSYLHQQAPESSDVVLLVTSSDVSSAGQIAAAAAGQLPLRLPDDGGVLRQTETGGPGRRRPHHRQPQVRSGRNLGYGAERPRVWCGETSGMVRRNRRVRSLGATAGCYGRAWVLW